MGVRIVSALAAVLIGGGIAQADMKITLDVGGYSELFKECEFSLGFDAQPPVASAVFAYKITLADKGPVECRATWQEGYVDTSCHAPPQTQYTCEEMTAVRAVGLACRDAGGADADCGSVTLSGPEPDFFIFD